MSLSAGTRLGPYEILSAIGAGGMGEVYRATDTKLKREVALKILPDAFASDPDRLARFTREAQTLAALNHPNIAQIYGFEDSGETRALVMELVEGPTLSDRITRGPIPLSEALPIAKQIAQALEAAHDQGIVHRDLKPANIKVRPDGTVKVLDFGLAKATEASGAAVDLANSPTITSPAMMTGHGIILGTAAYMSPEQARGKPVDKQTDIWAFGCVVYEMFTGRAAFAGETISDTIAKILEREPDWRALSVSTPVKIRDLLHRCLEKPQQRRLHDIADARIEIEDALTVQRKSRRVIGLPAAVTVVVLVLTLMAGAWWYAEKPTVSAPHVPVSILIADFKNHTSDPTFDRTLEPMLKIVLEGAGFISAYDRSRIRSTFGVQPPEKLDEVAARELAVKQGLGVVLSGSIERRGNGYEISVKAVQTVTGNVITSAQSLASSKDQVLEVVTKLVTDARRALGDEISESAKLFAMRSVSASSLDVVSHYAAAVEAQANGKFEDARESYLKAVELDPKFGLGYQGLAVMSRNLGRLDDADKYIREALRFLDGMTERERFGTRGFYFRMIGDNQQCAKEYGESLVKYPADTAAHNQRAGCLAKLRNMRGAMDEMRQALQVLPNHTGYRTNYALLADLAGDFQKAEDEVNKLQPDARVLQVLAYSQIGRGLLREATETYQKMSTMGTQGASSAASGLGDLAVYEGRFADAVRIFEQGVAADLASKSPDRAAIKFDSTAYAYLGSGQKAPAVAAAGKALLTSKAMPVRFLAARIFVETGEIDKARRLAAALSSELPAEPQAHGKIIEGQIVLKSGNARDAIKILTEANNLLDTWFGHFDLGRAYLETGAFPQADSEFERCIARRGEALSLMDEGPTYGHFPVVYYYQGRVREGLKTAGFAESYRAYLSIRGKAGEDPLLPEVRRRASSQARTK